MLTGASRVGPKRVEVQVSPLLQRSRKVPKVASTTGIGWTLLARSVRPLHLVSKQRSPVQVRLGADFPDLQIRGLGIVASW